MNKQLIAHLRKSDGEPQFLWEHLYEASKISGRLAGKIGLEKSGELLGLLHDLGKASEEFQNYIGSATGLIDPDEDEYVDVSLKKGKVDHSSAGAQFIYNLLRENEKEWLIPAQILSLCLASHHSGLIDCLLPSGEDNFTKRIEKNDNQTHLKESSSHISNAEKQRIEELASVAGKEVLSKRTSIKEKNDSKETAVFKYGLLIRYLFSCLIDADRLSTADFENPHNTRFRNYGDYIPWGLLIQRLDNKLREFEQKPIKNKVDVIRSIVSEACFSSASKPKGIYRLAVPTGGGKTLASLRFALNHANQHQMERIFYIIPYTSIIDQNADEVRKILEDKDDAGHFLDRVVLEHHSNLTPEEETHRQNLLAENWDAPIVFTTQVQFMETLFGAGTRSARRMHQLANSVIIFDEVQTIPIRCVHLFNVALRFLVHDCGATVVLCTATQPLLDQVEPAHRSLPISREQRIISDENDLYRKLKRVEVEDYRKPGGWSDAQVAELVAKELREKRSVLIVVNTKKSARSLCKTIASMNIGDVCHLSTNMCPAHRLDILSEVKGKLDKKEPVICVSTQLIEAGVDIDFSTVIRYQAGLDSIVQAAGRCNRNGRDKLGQVWIVNPSEENIEKLKDIRIGIEETERVLREFDQNPCLFDEDRIGLKMLDTYYRYYFFQRLHEMSYLISKQSLIGREDDLFNLLSVNLLSVDAYRREMKKEPTIPFRQSFQSAARGFYAIDSPTRGVVVPYKREGQEIINDLCSAYEIEKQYRLLKRSQRYTVNLFPQEWERMAEKEAIREVQKESGIFYLDKQYYNDQFGWSDESNNEMEDLII